MARASERPAAARRQLLEYALAKPGAYLDHPWGEDVARVGKKVFAFFGLAGAAAAAMTVKLPESQPLALAQPGVEPSGYGLGASGWVTIRVGRELPLEMLREWIDESYRAVAPKRRVQRPSRPEGDGPSGLSRA
jgi:predicted DNA-binding protein (MmcQ/YjbR family)